MSLVRCPSSPANVYQACPLPYDVAHVHEILKDKNLVRASALLRLALRQVTRRSPVRVARPFCRFIYTAHNTNHHIAIEKYNMLGTEHA